MGEPARASCRLTRILHKWVELLFLDPVLHVASGAIHPVAQPLRRTFQTGDDITRVGAPRGMPGLDDRPPGPAPGRGGVRELVEHAHLFAAGFVRHGRQFHDGRRFFGQRRVAGDADDADDVVHPVALAPRQHAATAESAVAAKNDLHLRPGPAQPFRQQGENRPGVPGAVAVARTRPDRRQPVFAEHAQGRKAVAVVIRGRNDLPACRAPDRRWRRSPAADGGAGSRRMRQTGPPAPRAGEPRLPGPSLARNGTGWKRRPASRRCPPPIAAPGPGAVRHGRSGLRIPAPARAPAAGPSSKANAGNWPCGAYRSATVRQHRAAVRGDRAAGKRGLHEAALAAWKTNGFQITIRHGRSPSISA